MHRTCKDWTQELGVDPLVPLLFPAWSCTVHMVLVFGRELNHLEEENCLSWSHCHRPMRMDSFDQLMSVFTESDIQKSKGLPQAMLKRSQNIRHQKILRMAQIAYDIQKKAEAFFKQDTMGRRSPFFLPQVSCSRKFSVLKYLNIFLSLLSIYMQWLMQRTSWLCFIVSSLVDQNLILETILDLFAAFFILWSYRRLHTQESCVFFSLHELWRIVELQICTLRNYLFLASLIFVFFHADISCIFW